MWILIIKHQAACFWVLQYQQVLRFHSLLGSFLHLVVLFIGFIHLIVAYSWHIPWSCFWVLSFILLFLPPPFIVTMLLVLSGSFSSLHLNTIPSAPAGRSRPYMSVALFQRVVLKSFRIINIPRQFSSKTESWKPSNRRPVSSNKWIIQQWIRFSSWSLRFPTQLWRSIFAKGTKPNGSKQTWRNSNYNAWKSTASAAAKRHA